MTASYSQYLEQTCIATVESLRNGEEISDKILGWRSYTDAVRTIMGIKDLQNNQKETNLVVIWIVAHGRICSYILYTTLFRISRSRSSWHGHPIRQLGF